MKVTVGILVLCLCAIVLYAISSKSNNILLGRVETTVGQHAIVVTDCYRTSVPPPQKLEDVAEGKTVYQFKPCRDANIIIRGEELIVNEKSYGRINPADAIAVDHGTVLVNERDVPAIATR